MTHIPMTPAVAAEIEALMDSRGAILTQFAQVEWFLAKIILEARALPEYRQLSLSFSTDAAKRAERLKQILAVAGPFSPYGGELVSIVDRVMEYVDLRSFSAHGVLITTFDNDGRILLRFKMFRMFKGGDDVPHEGVYDLTISQYMAAAIDLGSLTKQFLAVARRMWRDLGMNNMDP